jgi:RNA-directed DNA polymerase
MIKAPEPTDKLDALTAVAVVVNGPEDASFEWDAVDWRRVKDEVRRLRQRIFTASQAGDLKRVRSLQKLMLRSRSNTLLSVRRVTELNAGRLTAGVDGEVALGPQAKALLVDRIEHPTEPFRAMPVRRVYIPKKGSRTKRRPLGIPVILDRCHQARIASALEPEWEARFEPRSYGFRPGRGCHDAIQAIYQTIKGRGLRRWALDADLAGAFDNVAHDHILAMLGTFPAKGMIAQWLKAGVVEQGRLHRTEEGTPQGGVVSPALLNIALHGMEQAAGVRYYPADGHARRVVAGCPVLIRYADDLVCLCHSRQEAEQVKAKLAKWLAPRGLDFNEGKTRVVTLDEGFDFLGFNVRRYNGKPLIKPSTAAVRRIRKRLRDELRSLRGSNATAVIKRLNPIIRGWAAYYRTQVAAETFGKLDYDLWRLTWKWATFSHSNRPISWVKAQYFGRFNKARQDRWVFGHRASGAFLHRFAWTNIIRHPVVLGVASPDDPALNDYWARRRRKTVLPINHTARRLHQAQDGYCAICHAPLLPVDDPPQTPREWETWQARAQRTLDVSWVSGPSDTAEARLAHTYCSKRSSALLPARSPSRLA